MIDHTPFYQRVVASGFWTLMFYTTDGWFHTACKFMAILSLFVLIRATMIWRKSG